MSRILIGTPILAQTVSTTYLTACRSLERANPDIQFEYFFPQCSFVAFSRNAIVNKAMKEAFDYVLFIDSDMGFQPTLFSKMLMVDKPIVGCAYPSKRLNVDRPIEPNAAAPLHVADVVTAALEFVVDETVLETRGTFSRVSYAGTGILLVKVDALWIMSKNFATLWTDADRSPYSAFGITGSIFQCFTSARSADGVYLAEDMSFCLRWTQGCQGELWVCTDEMIAHHGDFIFEGAYERGAAKA